MTPDPTATPDDLARDLLADLAAAAPTDADLHGWGEDDLYDYVRRARVGWPAAIRCALAARAAVAQAALRKKEDAQS